MQINSLSQWVDKYLARDKVAIRLGLQLGVLAIIFSLLQVNSKPHNLAWIFAILGAFITTLIQVGGIKIALKRRVKYSFYLSILSGVATILGCYCGNYYWSTALGIIILIPLVALSSSAEDLLASVILFSVDLFIIASGVPATLKQSVIYGLFYTLGGFSLTLLSYLTPGAKVAVSLLPTGLSLKRLFHNYQHNLRFALLLTIAVSIANSISFAFHLPQGYWIPMTALLILKADHDFSKKRIKHRLFGTIIGSIITVILLLCITNKLILAFLMLPIMFLLVIGVARHYGAYTLFLTIMVAVLLSLVQQDGYMIAAHRLGDTLIGIFSVVVVLWGIQPIVIKFIRPKK